VVAIVGTAEGDPSEFTGNDGLAAIGVMARDETPLGEAMRDAARVLEERTAEILKKYVRGRAW
jgi:hypothetical protein